MINVGAETKRLQFVGITTGLMFAPKRKRLQFVGIITGLMLAPKRNVCSGRAINWLRLVLLSHYKLQSSRTAALMPRRYVPTVQVRLEAHPSKTCSAIFVGKPKQEMTEHVLRVCFPDTFTHVRCIHVYIHARSAEPETPYTDNWTQPEEQKSLNHRFEELTVLCWT